jgi:hypothetical protein
MLFFDYFFYRMTRAYMKRDGREARTAKLGLSALQCLLVLCVALVCLKPYFPRSVTAPESKLIGYGGVLIFVSVIFFNYRRYDRPKYNELLGRWQGETGWQKRLRGLCVYASVPLTLLFAFFLIALTD